MPELDELYLDYISYLIFMAKQMPWGYGPFTLIKALEKVLELQEHITEIRDILLYTKLREEMAKTQGWSSSEKENWTNFLTIVSEILIESL